MRSSTPAKSKNRTTQRRGTGTAARANRAQVRAMEARAAVAIPTTDVGPVDADDAVITTGRGATLLRRRPVARPKVLTRAQEYAYIRADMRRLVITAALLFVIMIVLLIVLD